MGKLYRGYSIDAHAAGDGGVVISRAGKVECSQPSYQFAISWIDEQKRKLSDDQKDVPRDPDRS